MKIKVRLITPSSLQPVRPDLRAGVVAGRARRLRAQRQQGVQLRPLRKKVRTQGAQFVILRFVSGPG
jgi:hypothetical protein